jgi:hypothetical protein
VALFAVAFVPGLHLAVVISAVLDARRRRPRTFVATASTRVKGPSALQFKRNVDVPMYAERDN